MLREWSDIYSIGIADIDAQHQGFFAAAHRLYDDILEREGKNAVEDAMAFMRNYAEEHFQTEVAFMRKHEYPGL